MADLSPKERLQPSLLDRLTDDEPHVKKESREKRVLSMHRLRESVLRDVSWLLNADPLESVVDLKEYPEVAKSVVNFGIKDLAGQTVSGANVSDVENSIRKSIALFEPRILPETLQVNVFTTEEMSQQAMNYDIEADLWAQPLPMHLYLRTEVNVVTGDVNLKDMDS